MINKISNHELRGEFVSNIEIDKNGTGFLDTAQHIAFIGKTKLETTYISDKRTLPIHKKRDFDVIGFKVTEYTVDANVSAAIAPIKATELVQMDGIANQSLFAYNVRGPLGKTGVNKEIRASIQKPELHKLFPLFHNGITIISKELAVSDDSISIDDYYVVNGCQSLTALYDNRKVLTDDLRVLIKFIKLEPTSPFAKTVTEFSNNQNGVRERDFMSNDQTQVRLQNEFKTHYAGDFWLEIKRGEVKGDGRKISNEDAGLLIMAFDLKEPWGTHRKYQVFDEKYTNIFGKPDVTADRIVMLQVISDAITEALPHIENSLVAKYNLARYALVYVVRNVLEKDALFTELVTAPQNFVRDKAKRERFLACVRGVVGDVIEGLNSKTDVGEEDDQDFDYRGKLRDEQWVKELSKGVVTEHMILLRRGKIQSFSEEWNAA